MSRDTSADLASDTEGTSGLDVTVVIPATDDPGTLDHCLAAIKASTVPVGDVVVVRDRIADSPSAARNLGVERSSGSIIVFVDADVLVHPDAIGIMIGHLERDPGLVAVFGAYDDEPGAPGVVSGFRYLLHHYIHLSAAGECESFWTGLGAVRREAFDRAGGFYLRPAMEDIDLGLRLADDGGRILCEPEARGRHLKELGLVEMVRTDIFLRAAPWVALMLERRSMDSGFNLSPRNRILALLTVAFVVSLAIRRPRAAFGSVIAFALVDLPFLRLVARTRGMVQAAASIPLHMLHHIAGIIGLGLGLLRHGPGALRAVRARGSFRSGRPQSHVRPPS